RRAPSPGPIRPGNQAPDHRNRWSRCHGAGRASMTAAGQRRDSAQAYDCSSRARPVLREEDLVMRWFVIAIVAVTALAGATFAFASAGSEGDQGTGTAYALVDPYGGVA